VLTCDHEIKNGSSTPGVDFFIVVLFGTFEHLWGLVHWSSSVGHHQYWIRKLGAVESLRDVEVDETHLHLVISISRDDNVVWINVSVADAIGMQVLYALK